MPLYDYACTECGRGLEVRHGVHEEGPRRCAYCGGRMRQVFSPTAVHFKGSGWAKKERAAARSSPSAGHAGRGEAKPAADAEAKPGADAGATSPATGESRSEGGTETGPDKREGAPAGGASGATGGGRSDA
jgi:putative FmdB family regulatory protein